MKPATQRRGRGRPPGHMPIHRSPARFARALYEDFQFGWAFSHSAAARAAIAFREARFAIVIRASGISICAPFFDGEDTGIEGRAGTITRTRRQIRTRSTAPELEWLDGSAAYFHTWLHAAARGDEAEEAVALEQLRRIDLAWPAIIRDAVDVLLDAPLVEDRSVRSLTERQPLPKPLQRLLKAIMRRRGKDLDEIFRAGSQATNSPKR